MTKADATVGSESSLFDTSYQEIHRLIEDCHLVQTPGGGHEHMTAMTSLPRSSPVCLALLRALVDELQPNDKP